MMRIMCKCCTNIVEDAPDDWDEQDEFCECDHCHAISSNPYDQWEELDDYDEEIITRGYEPTLSDYARNDYFR